MSEIKKIIDKYNPQMGLSDNQVNEIVEEIEKVETGEHWISVKKSLPQTSKKNPRHLVLTYIKKYKDRASRYVLQSFLHDEQRFYTDAFLKIKVTHWMPLPPCPK